MEVESADFAPGPVVLFGSGETSYSGRKVFDLVLQELPARPRIGLLETPAGFELNSDRVIGRISEFLLHNLQNYRPQPFVIPARRRGTAFSPDDETLVAPLLDADLIFMGPGSPTYTVRQLQGSRAWQYLVARHRLGAPLVMASAAAIAIGTHVLPVYEIYKVGEDLHWKAGLGLLGAFGLHVVVIPHWNNNDGGAELDTSRCFMGQERFLAMMSMLPAGLSVLGIDENTAIIFDLQAGVCRVLGQDGVTLIHTGHNHSGDGPDLSGTGLDEVARQRDSHIHHYCSGESFPLAAIGPFRRPNHPGAGLPDAVWQAALAAQQTASQATSGPPQAVQALLEQRAAAREAKDWSAADTLRAQIQELGWVVKDTRDGQVVEPGDPAADT